MIGKGYYSLFPFYRMKKPRFLLGLPAVLLFAGVVPYIVWAIRVPAVAPNPDPNHIHADFAVWVRGTQFDFSKPQYMTAEAQEESFPIGNPRKYLHLHDGNGHVIHIHKPGLTFGDFFASLGMSFRPPCVRLDASQNACDAGDARWRMFVNGNEVPVNPGYVLHDLDHLLLTYGADDREAQRELGAMTDDACRYSKTCPRRGPPPTEGCVADPSVPCNLGS